MGFGKAVNAFSTTQKGKIVMACWSGVFVSVSVYAILRKKKRKKVKAKKKNTGGGEDAEKKKNSSDPKSSEKKITMNSILSPALDRKALLLGGTVNFPFLEVFCFLLFFFFFKRSNYLLRILDEFGEKKTKMHNLSIRTDPEKQIVFFGNLHSRRNNLEQKKCKVLHHASFSTEFKMNQWQISQL